MNIISLSLIVQASSSPLGTEQITVIVLGVFGATFLIYKFVSTYKENKRKSLAYDESQIQNRITVATADTARQLEAKIKELAQVEAKLAAALLDVEQCERRTERIEAKANEVAKQDAQLKGALEDFIRGINNLFDDGCPHCGKAIIGKTK